ncbi:MAG: hypothetical protein ABL957_15150, partial [Parvularculaceae bacterium]
MSAIRLMKFDANAPARLARIDLAEPPAAPPAQEPPAPDPHAVLFQNACARFVCEIGAAERALRAEAVEALRRTIRAIAPALIEEGARQSLGDLLRAFGSNADDVRIEIVASAATIGMLESAGAARLTFIADEDMAPGDFRAAWPQGGMIRDAHALIEGVLGALAAAGEDGG